MTKKYSYVIVCGIDDAGHRNGYGTPAHLACIHEVDKLINDVHSAATVLYAPGISAPELNETGWTSQIPNGIFEDLSIPEYRDFSHLTGAAPRISRVPHTSELI